MFCACMRLREWGRRLLVGSEAGVGLVWVWKEGKPGGGRFGAGFLVVRRAFAWESVSGVEECGGGEGGKGVQLV